MILGDVWKADLFSKPTKWKNKINTVEENYTNSTTGSSSDTGKIRFLKGKNHYEIFEVTANSKSFEKLTEQHAVEMQHLQVLESYFGCSFIALLQLKSRYNKRY